MSVCPWCKRQVPKANIRCPSCGQDPTEHPSIASTGQGTCGGFDDFDELSPSDDAQAGDAGADLAGPDRRAGLELDLAPRTSMGQVAVGDTTVSIPAEVPPGSLPSSTAIALDPYDIAVLADYGPVPRQAWQLPGYAWRVYTRRAELRRRLAGATGAVAAAEQAKEEVLASLAERVRGALEAASEMAPIVEKLAQLERTAQTRAQALQTSSSEHQSRVASLDTQVAQVDQQLAVVRGQQDKAEAEARACEERLGRAQAACKRAEIELRNTQDLARKAAGPTAETAPPEFAQQLIDLQTVLLDRQAAVVAPKRDADAARAVVAQIGAQRQQIERLMRDLRAQRAGLEQAFAREAGVRNQGVQEAMDERRRALVQVALQLFALNWSGLSPQDHQVVKDAQAQVDTRQLEVRRWTRAIESADDEAVRKGVVIAAVAAGAVVLLLVVLAVLFGTSEGS